MLPADREIRLGIWKIHILHHAATREVWGKWLIEELAEHGHRLSPGTLYPALARMEANGWLRRTGKARHARARQTFLITPDGRRLLHGLQHDVAELYEEVVLGREPERGTRRTAKHGARTARTLGRPNSRRAP
jgi:PadR family transcriptional regulator PadR